LHHLKTFSIRLPDRAFSFVFEPLLLLKLYVILVFISRFSALTTPYTF